MEEITQILRDVQRCEAGASTRLIEAVYGELRRMAAVRLGREQAPQTLQPTALVHEMWLRLGADRQPAWENRRHFFAAAAEAMRRLLIERARRRRAARHGGGQERVDAEQIDLAAAPVEDTRLLAVDEAIEELAAVDAGAAELVKLHYFAGLPMREAAEALGISESTAWRWWSYARAWLYRALGHP